MSLVLSRQEDESLILFTESGEAITITFDQLNGKTAKLTIDAPKSVKILRGELIEIAHESFDP